MTTLFHHLPIVRLHEPLISTVLFLPTQSSKNKYFIFQSYLRSIDSEVNLLILLFLIKRDALEIRINSHVYATHLITEVFLTLF